MNRYFNEMARTIKKFGLIVTPYEESEMLSVFHKNSPFCEVRSNGIRYYPDFINTEEKKGLLDIVQDHHRTVSEYINAYEKAPELKAVGLDDGYRLLAEYNRVVLAVMDQKEYGYQFATWDRTYGDTGLTLGHYTNDYESAKEDFAIRSGLVSKHKVFNDDQMKDIYNALDYYRNEIENLTVKQEDAIKEIMKKIEYAVPGVESALDTEQTSGMNMEI